MGRRIATTTSSDEEAGYLVRKFMVALFQAVDERDRTTHPPCVEWDQCHDEAKDLLRKLERKDASDEHTLSELRAWSESRPLPVQDAFKKETGCTVTRPSTVFDVMVRSGVFSV